MNWLSFKSLKYCIVGNLRGRKIFANGGKLRFLRRKLLRIARSCHAKGHHAPQISWIKTSQIVTKPRNSRKLSPSKVSCYTV